MEREVGLFLKGVIDMNAEAKFWWAGQVEPTVLAVQDIVIVCGDEVCGSPIRVEIHVHDLESPEAGDRARKSESHGPLID